jgi:hypothetical protein
MTAFLAAVLAYAIAAVAHCVIKRRAGYSVPTPYCRALLGLCAAYLLVA